MGQTRLEKYKDYRSSIITEDAPSIDGDNISHDNGKSFQSTSTLPMDQVIQTLNEDNAEMESLRKIRKKKIIKYSILISLAIIVVAAIIIVGIILFKQ